MACIGDGVDNGHQDKKGFKERVKVSTASLWFLPRKETENCC